MFKSLQRDVVIPQSEHLKLAGSLALLWGNDPFERPPLPHLSVVAGIGLHDRGYGYLDNLAIGEMDDETWLAVTRKGFSMPCADSIADVIARHHLLRLVSGKKTPSHNALADEMREALQRQMKEAGFEPETFRRIDRMTELCDKISFYFCQETPAEGAVEVWARYRNGRTLEVHYRISAGEIRLDPWPLAIESHDGYVVGYRGEGYPERVEGLAIPYRIRRGTS